MVVNNSNDRNCGHPPRVDSTILFLWKWVMAWCENQSVGMDEIDSVLFVPPAVQLVTSVRPRRWHQ